MDRSASLTVFTPPLGMLVPTTVLITTTITFSFSVNDLCHPVNVKAGQTQKPRCKSQYVFKGVSAVTFSCCSLVAMSFGLSLASRAEAESYHSDDVG